MLAWYRRLAHLRRENEELHDGRFDRTTVSVDAARRRLIMHSGRLLFACSSADHALAVKGTAPAQDVSPSRTPPWNEPPGGLAP